jgi:serine/threonine-protein kinase RsbW
LASARCLDLLVDPAALRGHMNVGQVNPSRRFEVDIPLRDGRTFVAVGAPLLDTEGELLGRIWYLSDDTQRREAEASREELLDRLRTAQRGQTFLLQAIDVIGRASSYTETLERLAAISVPALADLCLIDVLSPDGELVRMTARHADPAKRALTDELARSYSPAGASTHPSAEAVETMESRWSADMSAEFLRETTCDQRHFELVTELGFESYMSVPLVDQGRALGCVTLVSAGSGRHFGAADLALAENLAARVSQVVSRARRYDLEHLASHALQSSLLPPPPPTITGLSVASRYLPGTTGAEVGGDFHDVVLLESGAVALALGDVMGHDLTAAATMGQLRSAFRVLLELTEGPASLVTQLQSSWRMLGLSRFATAAFARLDPATGQLRVASAGHPSPLLVADGRSEFLDVEPGSPLGVPSAGGAEWRGELPVGGTLLFFSDGLVEDRRHDIDTGLERLRRVIHEAGTADPELLCDAAIDELVPADRNDDVAMLAVTRR